MFALLIIGALFNARPFYRRPFDGALIKVNPQYELF